MRKSDVKTVEDLEKYYDQVRKIKFKGNFEIKDIGDIYFRAIEKRHETTFIRGGFQCDQGRVRSIDDVIKLYKYYFPEKRIKNFFVEINNLCNNIRKNDKPIYVLNYCPNIKKYNFQYTTSWNCNNYYKTISINNRHKFKGQGFPNCDVQFNDVLES